MSTEIYINGCEWFRVTHGIKSSSGCVEFLLVWRLNESKRVFFSLDKIGCEERPVPLGVGVFWPGLRFRQDISLSLPSLLLRGQL